MAPASDRVRPRPLFAGREVGGGCEVRLRLEPGDSVPENFTVFSNAADPRSIRMGAGSWSTLLMIAAAIRAGSPGASPLAGSRIRTGYAPACRHPRRSSRRPWHCRSGTQCAPRRPDGADT